MQWFELIPAVPTKKSKQFVMSKIKNSHYEFHQKIVQTLSERYDKKLIDNRVRGDYVEVMISELLGEDWGLTWKMPKHNSWSAWDLENKNTGKNIEVI